MIKRYLDVETYCNLDLKDVGLKNYIEHPSFEINLIGWVDIDDSIFTNMDTIEKNFKQVPGIYNEEWKQYFIEGFNDDNIILVSHNVAFEIVALEKALGITVDLDKVECTMVKCYQSGLPGALGKASEVLRLKYAKAAGTALINYFAKPCKPTKVNLGRTRNYPSMNPVKWAEYCEYNRYDVLSMVELDLKILSKFSQPESEKRLWKLDYQLNHKGIRVDTGLIVSAVQYVLTHEASTKAKMEKLTGLINPNSTAQLKGWLTKKCPEIKITSIAKEHLKTVLEETHNAIVEEVIKCRQALAKTSNKKYITLEKINHKGKLYNLLQFAATGTGRWAGRGFQVHNLPRNKIGKEIYQIREAYKNQKRPITDNLTFELSQLLRTVIIPDPGKVLLVCDYSAIEARVAAWVAGEKWVLDVFRGDGKIYEAMASRMFGTPLEKITHDERQDGKVAVLAGGYGGGYRAFQQFAPDWSDDKAQIMVDFFRESNPKIVNTWSRIEKAVKYTIKNNVTTKINSLITFKMVKGCLLIVLPSGRTLNYVRAKIVKDDRLNTVSRNEKVYHYEKIRFEQINSLNKAWGIAETYGGRLFENIVQAIARDLLAHALLELDTYNHDILFHVHDEIITQVDNDKDLTLEMEILKLRMCRLPDWADGLPINAEGFNCDYYMKEEEK